MFHATANSTVIHMVITVMDMGHTGDMDTDHMDMAHMDLMDMDLIIMDLMAMGTITLAKFMCFSMRVMKEGMLIDIKNTICQVLIIFP